MDSESFVTSISPQVASLVRLTTTTLMALRVRSEPSSGARASADFPAACSVAEHFDCGWTSKANMLNVTIDVANVGSKTIRSRPSWPVVSYDAAFFALYSAQRFLVAAMMRFRPVALSLRFLGVVFAGGVSLTFFVEAYLLRWAADIRARVAALNRRRLRAGREAAADSVVTVPADFGGRPLRFCPSARIPSKARTCSMCCSIVCFALQSVQSSIQHVGTQTVSLCGHVIRLCLRS
jgi:hypothetical protein